MQPVIKDVIIAEKAIQTYTMHCMIHKTEVEMDITTTYNHTSQFTSGGEPLNLGRTSPKIYSNIWRKIIMILVSASARNIKTICI